MYWVWYVVMIVISAVFYRLGGKSGYDTKFRDLGVPTVIAGFMIFVTGGYPWWAHLLSFGLLFASLTTYHTWLNNLFGDPKYNKYWYNWLVTGACYSLSTLPYVVVSGHWWAYLYRTITLAVLTMIWCEFWVEDKVEEMGRGALLASTLIIILL